MRHLTGPNPSFQGLYVGVPLKPAPEIALELGDLPKAMGRPIKPENLHSTLFYPNSAPIPVTTERDVQNMQELRTEVASTLADMKLAGHFFSVKPPKLAGIQKFIGIWVADPPEPIVEARNTVAGLIKKHTGVQVNQKKEWMHIALMHRPPSSKLVVQCDIDRFDMQIAEDRQPEVSIGAASLEGSTYLYSLPTPASRQQPNGKPGNSKKRWF